MLTSGFPPIFVLVVIFGVLAVFFRKMLRKTLSVLAVEIVFFLIFPVALLKFVELITSIRHHLG